MVSITLPDLFQNASYGSGSFRKNISALSKVHLKSGAAASNSKASSKNATVLQTFHQEFLLCVYHILPVKKGNAYAERSLKFIVAYLEFLGDESSETYSLQVPLLSQLVEYLLSSLEAGLRASNKVVRYRVCQLMAILLNHLTEIDDTLFMKIREGLLERVKDKETSVRLQASTALSRLQECGDKVDNARISQALLDLLQYDTSTDIRKNVLWNIDINKRTFIPLLSKARDADAGVRKLLYVKLGEDIPEMSKLSLDQRDALLHAGLSDRDAQVKKSCLKLLCEKWIPAVGDDIIVLLTKLDLHAGKSSGTVLESFFSVHPELEFKYESEAWAKMNAQIAFLLRHYCAYCSKNNLLEKMEDTLPVLSEHAEFLERYCELMLSAESEDDHTAHEFVLGQLLAMAEYQDLSDEMGRHRLLSTCRRLLVATDLSTDLITSVVHLICKTADNEEDYMLIMVEVLYEIDDALIAQQQEGTEETLEADQLEKAISMLKCLDILKCVLENSQQTLKENASIYGLLERFVIPSIQSPNSALQTEGLICLGLCCIMDITLAKNNISLFLRGLGSGDVDVISALLKIVFDILTVYGLDGFEDAPKDVFVEIVRNALESDVDEILSIAVEGSARLLLLGRIQESAILQSLFILYYHPSTSGMTKLQQSLNFFFHAFAFSSLGNQVLIGAVFLSTLKVLVDVHASTEETMLSPSVIAQQLIDWTDARRLIEPAKSKESAVLVGSGECHIHVAEELMGAAVKESTSTAHKKIYAQVLAKLPISQLTADQYAKIMMLSGQLLAAISGDAVTTNAIKRFTKKVMTEHKSPEAEDEPEATSENVEAASLVDAT